MRAMMMDVPLSVSSILLHAAQYHGQAEVVSRSLDGTIHRTTYADLGRRCARLANALSRLGIKAGERVGTLAWNGYRHLEVYYGAASAGLVCHTINPRLFPDQIEFIVNHASDRVLFTDLDFLPLIALVATRLTQLETVVVMTDALQMPAKSLGSFSMLCYEDLLEAESDSFSWPVLDENTAAALCYTSGTTGYPKGVLYSHRSIVLHAMMACTPDAFALSARSVIMPAVPMFHVNAWGLPYAAAIVGAKLVLPGSKLDGASLHGLISAERVTFTAGVPTVWMALLDWVMKNGLSLEPLERVAIGGSTCPPVMYERFRNLDVTPLHVWGMTETSPVGLTNTPKAGMPPKAPEEEARFAAKQGRPVFPMQFRVMDATGAEIACNGTAFGDMQVRGPWVASSYYGDEPNSSHAGPGWLSTGDVVTMDADGYFQVVDRSKDVIKSGGEWISSIELENIALSHPAVQEAACVARPDAHWGERPLLVVVARPDAATTEEEILSHFSGRVPRWRIPDSVVFAPELPHTATGKLLKTKIRELYCMAPKSREFGMLR
jgi:3-(methylthio)propionyl---CoA ligase